MDNNNKPKRAGFILRFPAELHNGAGFTLIEILISLAIFALLSLAVAAIYISFNTTQIRTTVSQQLLNDSQYALELMAKEIRNSSIVKYELNSSKCNALIKTVDDQVVFDSCIILEKENGQTFAFTSYDYEIESFPATQLLYVLLNCEDDYSSCDLVDLNQPLNFASILEVSLNNVNLDNLSFFITPSSDPFKNNGPNEQPKITITMTTSYFSDNPTKKVSHTLQTTVSSRIYRR